MSDARLKQLRDEFIESLRPDQLRKIATKLSPDERRLLRSLLGPDHWSMFDDPSERHLAYVEPDFESMRRGGSCRMAACLCGWRGPQRATLELATDDALMHERELQKAALP